VKAVTPVFRDRDKMKHETSVTSGTSSLHFIVKFTRAKFSTNVIFLY